MAMMMPASSIFGGGTPTPLANASNPWQGGMPFVPPLSSGPGIGGLPTSIPGLGSFNPRATIEALQGSGSGSGGTGGPPQAPVQNWQNAANPVQAYQQYENDYANYVNQNAAYQNALRGQGQPQGFGVPEGGFGGMMRGGSGGFDMNAIMQLLERMGGQGGGNFGSIFNGGGGFFGSSPNQSNWMGSIAQMVSPQVGGWSW